MSGPNGRLIESSVPVLETERLRLRAHRADDHAACTAIWSDPEVTRYVGGRPFTAEEVWKRLLQYAGMWSGTGHGGNLWGKIEPLKEEPAAKDEAAKPAETPKP